MSRPGYTATGSPRDPRSCATRARSGSPRAASEPTSPGRSGSGEGEVVIKSDFLLKEYWNRPDATRDAFDNGWFRTGDIGEIDDEGYLYIKDRLKDMIISGGENIYPAEIENVIIGCE